MIRESKIMDNNQLHVTLAGSMYAGDANRMQDSLISFIDKGQTSLLIDLSQVDYIDGTGLGVLISIHKRTLLKGGKLTLTGIHGLVEEVFELTRLNTVFEIQH